MTRTFTLTLVALATISLLAPTVAAQGGRGQGPGMPNYDPETEIRVSGTVGEVTYPDGPRGWQGVHLALQTGEDLYDIHLGPRSYVEEQGFSFAVGDEIEVLGSQVQCQGEDALLAREIRSGKRTLTLRDENGRPEWAPRPRQPASSPRPLRDYGPR